MQNILAELQRMGVSIVRRNGGISFRGERASEAIRRFKPHKQRIVDEVGKYHEAKAKGASQKTIDMARAIASAWAWSADDWEYYFSYYSGCVNEEVAKFYDSELDISPWRYECAGVN